jgi:hypothetical protein
MNIEPYHNYKEKYLKYKTKYNELKSKQLSLNDLILKGGTKLNPNEIDEILQNLFDEKTFEDIKKLIGIGRIEYIVNTYFNDKKVIFKELKQDLDYEHYLIEKNELEKKYYNQDKAQIKYYSEILDKKQFEEFKKYWFESSKSDAKFLEWYRGNFDQDTPYDVIIFNMEDEKKIKKSIGTKISKITKYKKKYDNMVRFIKKTLTKYSDVISKRNYKINKKEMTELLELAMELNYLDMDLIKIKDSIKLINSMSKQINQLTKSKDMFNLMYPSYLAKDIKLLYETNRITNCNFMLNEKKNYKKNTNILQIDAFNEFSIEESLFIFTNQVKSTNPDKKILSEKVYGNDNINHLDGYYIFPEDINYKEIIYSDNQYYLINFSYYNSLLAYPEYNDYSDYHICEQKSKSIKSDLDTQCEFYIYLIQLCMDKYDWYQEIIKQDKFVKKKFE